MKTLLIPLAGDPAASLYQLGLKEKDAFLKLETRVSCLLSTSSFLRYGQELLSKARGYFRKPQESLFDQCIKAYCEGLGIDPARYYSFLSLLELAAHYGQTYPELKGLLPGCTSVLASSKAGITHSRLLDFPLIGIFEENPRLYYWKSPGGQTLLSYSCEGLAPLFFQGIHGSGFSFALHHKPGPSHHKDGQSIFQIAFESFFEAQDFASFKKVIRKKSSVTKWCFILLDKTGTALVMDIDGPAINSESYNVHETSPLIFTNIPLQNDAKGFESYLKLCQDRQSWLKGKISPDDSSHPLDVMTDVEDQKTRKWLHPCATLSTVGAFHVNLTEGQLDIKEGHGALVRSDAIMQFSLGQQTQAKAVKKATKASAFETAWKRASRAQCHFDHREFDLAYHELQMARALMPNPMWKEIFSFYLLLWDFKFISNSRELAQIYKKVKILNLPAHLNDQKKLLIMRLEKRLDLASTVSADELTAANKELFEKELSAPKALFATWMKLIYPRLELLDVISPHQGKG